MNIEDIKKVKEMADLGLKDEDIQAYLDSDRTKTVEEFISSLDSHEKHMDEDIEKWAKLKAEGMA